MEIKSPTGGCCIPPRGEGYAIHNKNTKWPSLSCLEVLFGLRVVWVDFQYWRIFWFARWKVSSPSRFSFFWALVLDNHMILCGIRKTFDKSHEDRHKGSRGESNCCIKVSLVGGFSFHWLLYLPMSSCYATIALATLPTCSFPLGLKLAYSDSTVVMTVSVWIHFNQLFVFNRDF